MGKVLHDALRLRVIGGGRKHDPQLRTPPPETPPRSLGPLQKFAQRSTSFNPAFAKGQGESITEGHHGVFQVPQSPFVQD